MSDAQIRYLWNEYETSLPIEISRATGTKIDTVVGVVSCLGLNKRVVREMAERMPLEQNTFCDPVLVRIMRRRIGKRLVAVA